MRLPRKVITLTLYYVGSRVEIIYKCSTHVFIFHGNCKQTVGQANKVKLDNITMSLKSLIREFEVNIQFVYIKPLINIAQLEAHCHFKLSEREEFNLM